MRLLLFTKTITSKNNQQYTGSLCVCVVDVYVCVCVCVCVCVVFLIVFCLFVCLIIHNELYQVLSVCCTEKM